MNNLLNLKLVSEIEFSAALYPDVFAPFLSIIMRTQGRRQHCLVEALTCLAAQSDTDFEVLLVGHCLEGEARQRVLELVEDCPEWLRQRVRFIAVDGGTRTRPLKVGSAAARGAYIAVLDDDDIVFAHWVERFRELARTEPGRVLRCNTVRQVVDTVSVQGLAGLRAAGAPELRYPGKFNFFEHILENRTPPMMLAFPRRLVEQEGIDFDETLTTTEDWDFFMRCAQAIGVADGPGVTSVYRWWDKGESSRTVHLANEWRANHWRIWENWDNAGFRLPPGGMRELVSILQEHAAFGAELRRQQAQGARLAVDPALFNRNPEQLLASATQRVGRILDSTCWRMTRPLRQLSCWVTGKCEVDAASMGCATLAQTEALIVALYTSRSWHLTAPVRALRGLYDKICSRQMGW